MRTARQFLELLGLGAALVAGLLASGCGAAAIREQVPDAAVVGAFQNPAASARCIIQTLDLRDRPLRERREELERVLENDQVLLFPARRLEARTRRQPTAKAGRSRGSSEGAALPRGPAGLGAEAMSCIRPQEQWGNPMFPRRSTSNA